MLFCYLLQMLLHTLLATSGLLSYCFLPIISKWSSHPPLTSINKALSLLSPNAPGLKGGGGVITDCTCYASFNRLLIDG